MEICTKELSNIKSRIHPRTHPVVRDELTIDSHFSIDLFVWSRVWESCDTVAWGVFRLSTEWVMRGETDNYG